MTISWDTFGTNTGWESYGKCGKPAKYRNPEPDMGVEFVCGVHARSINKFYERVGKEIRCVPL